MKTKRADQRGSMLLESLIAILVFSMGILALVGMQANAIGHVADAKYRADASFLANQIIAGMWVDRANLAAYATAGVACDASGSNLEKWACNVNAALPGAAANPPTIAVAGNQVTVTVSWQPRGASTAHNHTAVSFIANP